MLNAGSSRDRKVEPDVQRVRYREMASEYAGEEDVDGAVCDKSSAHSVTMPNGDPPSLMLWGASEE